MTCAEIDCERGLQYQCPYCESDYCIDHIIHHSLCDVIELQNTKSNECISESKHE